jgi:hypothetical protein
MKPGDHEFQIVPLRTAEITLNINKFLNNSVGGFTINEIDLSGLSTGRIDCTISIKHPLAGLDQFDIFDVWGVFMHNGATNLYSNGMYLTYSGGPNAGENEAVLLNPDGYTRWFNKPEFDGDGPAFLEYYPLGFSNLPEPTAYINPFKIFTDSLLKNDDYYNWICLSENSVNRNIFRAGLTNSRRYEIQFPLIGGAPKIQFQFAVVANWEPGDPTLTGNPDFYDPGDFPTSANVEEPFFIHSSTDESTSYYDESFYPPKTGGDFIADIEIFDWQGGEAGSNGILNEIEKVTIEFDDPDQVGDFWIYYIEHPEIDAFASPGTENSSVVRVEFDNAPFSGSGEKNFMIIVEAAGLRGGSYYQGVQTEFPEGTSRAAYSLGSVWVSPEAPIENTPPDITGIEDDILGPGSYKNPVSADDTSVTYSPIFTDPDSGQTHEIVWWIVDDGTLPYPGGIVEMPIDWSTYIPGEYDIFVTVDDSYGPVQSGPYDITLEETVIPVWSAPFVIDFQGCMPRAVENWDDELVLIYYKEDNGISYSEHAGIGWQPPDTAYYWTDGVDKQTEPTYLSITRGEFGHIVYGSFQGWANDENSFSNLDRHAIRWDGEAPWDYTYLWGSTYLDTLLLPDDDDSFLNVYTVRLLGDPGPELRGADREYWGQQDQDPGLLPVYDEAICATSNCNAAVRDNTYHYIAYRQWGYNVAAKLARVSKSSVLDHQEFTIYQADPGEMVDSVSLAMDNSGTLHAAWRVSTNDTMWIDYAKSTDLGETWTDPVTVNKVDIWQGFLENYIGIVTDSNNKIYITFTQDAYIYMCKSSNGEVWSAPDSPYTGPLPLGYHWTQPYPVMTMDNILHIFYISKNDQFQFGAIIEVTYH